MAAAVPLFSAHGYDSTSMRAIADAAGVNLASANYHFGSKSDLFDAALQHCVAPLNAERFKNLELLEAMPAPPSVEQVVRAFVDVGIAKEGDATLSRLIARIFVEPQEVSNPRLVHTFGPIVARFVGVLKTALPEVSTGDIEWRFHFLIGALLQLVRTGAPLKFPGAQAPELGIDGQIDELVKFVAAGLRQSNSNSAGETR